MPDCHATITIQNCNNITSGSIEIQENCLNILFGRNGTGKSTIAQAIEISSNPNPLYNKLVPYGKANSGQPKVEGCPFRRVAVFNNAYLQQYTYQRDTVLKDAFEILVRTPEYDDCKRRIDEALSDIRNTISQREQIVLLQRQLDTLLSCIKLTDNNALAKRDNGTKAVLQGKGGFFNPPTELTEMSPFFQDGIVVKWADWRTQGQEQYGQNGICPYCAAHDDERSQTVSRVFAESFDKPSVVFASAIRSAIEALSGYISAEKSQMLLGLFGTKGNPSVIESQLLKLGVEAQLLRRKLQALIDFNASAVDRGSIAALDERLNSLKIDPRMCDTFFNTAQINAEIEGINQRIGTLLEMVSVLKGEIGKYNRFIERTISDRKDDINSLLKSAGYRYLFDIEITGEGNARALLKYVLPDGTAADTQAPAEALSWGERHAFALLLFMYDAIKKDADLIVLDDPISSFDSNKKYALINRLFKTGDRGNSLY